MKEQEILEALRAEVEAQTPDLLHQLLAECGFSNAAGDEAPSGEEGAVPIASVTMAADAAAPGTEAADVTAPGAEAADVTAPGAETADVMPSAAGAPADRPSTDKKGRKRRLYYFALAAAAALFVLAAVYRRFGQTAPLSGAGTKIPVASVGIDVNPSVELVIDEDTHVLSCTAVNEEAKKLIAGLDLTGMDVTASSEKLLDVMMEQGYLTDSANSILLSVSSEEVGKGQRLKEQLTHDLRDFLKNSHFDAAIVGQYLPSDTDTEDFAKRNGISVGKAWIVKNLEAAKSTLREEDLLQLSTQELLLLLTELEKSTAKKETVPERDYTISGKVSKSDYIAPEEAVSIALSHAGLTEAEMVSCEFDCYEGTIVYEVEFVADGVEYEVKVQGQTGNVLEMEIESAESDGDDSDDDGQDDDEPDDDGADDDEADIDGPDDEDD